MKKFMIRLSFIVLVTILAACGSDTEEISLLKFTDTGYDSVKIHNFIAQTIIEEGYGIDTESATGSTAAVFAGLHEGDVQVAMEYWTENQKEMLEAALEAEQIVDLGTNFMDKGQGLYVPTYVIEGDEERGIEPMAPDLQTMEDLKHYPDVFADPEDPGRGRIINSPAGWTTEEVITEKIKTYGLDETMNNFIPGSDSALVADLVRAYEKGEPWVGYYWSPTWVTAKYDLTLLEEPEYDKEIWDKNKGTAYPLNDVIIAVNEKVPEQFPEIVEFLKKYEIETEMLEEALRYLAENDLPAEEVGEWWMQENEDIWTTWVPDDIATKVKESLN